jgi:VWFA-related protein
MIKLPLCVLLLLFLGPSVLAQQPGTLPPPPVPQLTPAQKPEDDDVVKITTNLVQVDAVVTDSKGKLVTDLKPEEVAVFEDGRKQKITHFSLSLEPATVAPASETKSKPPVTNAPPASLNRLRPEDVRRTIAIVVDDLGLSFESTYFVRRALKKFVDEQMQPGDLVAIIRTSGGMGALQQFTVDKRQLYAAIDRVKYYPAGRSGISAFAPIQAPTEGPQGADIDAFNKEANQTREDMFAVGTLGAISYVIKGLKDLPGRKGILLLSDGFRIFSKEDPNANFQARERLTRLIDQANRASVVIYTMNATGLQTLNFTASDDLSGRNTQQMQDALSARRDEAFETQEGLDVLARETGGIPIRNTNDLSGGIRRVLEDQKGFYLIGYRPDEMTFDRRTGRRTYHKLTLKVTRPGKFNVRMRNGFYGVTDEDKPVRRSLAQQMYDALASPFGSTGVHVQLTSLFANDIKAGTYMRSVLYVDTRDLTFTEEADHSHKSTFDVLAMTVGDNGVTLDQIGRTYVIQLPDDVYKRTVRDGLVYYITVPVKKPGAYQLRMSFRDTASERIGSASQFIEVPDIKKNRLTLSSIVLRGNLPNANRANANPAEAPPQDQEGLDKGSAEASPAVRHFRHGMMLTYGTYIYNARLDKADNLPKLTTQVQLFRDGKPVFTGKELPLQVKDAADWKRLTAGGAIQIGTDLPAGDYVLQLTVTDALADQKHRTATQWMDFSILN